MGVSQQDQGHDHHHTTQDIVYLVIFQAISGNSLFINVCMQNVSTSRFCSENIRFSQHPVRI